MKKEKNKNILKEIKMVSVCVCGGVIYNNM